MGLEGVKALVGVSVGYAEDHQMAVIDCLDSIDETIQVFFSSANPKELCDSHSFYFREKLLICLFKLPPPPMLKLLPLECLQI